MSEKEILAYAITHAGRTPEGKAIKGGPYEAEGGVSGTPCRKLASAYRHDDREWIEAVAADARDAGAKDARVIRIVRKARPSEASAVEVLRALVAWDEDCEGGEHDIVIIAESARAVLAASGPDPSEVVRDLVMHVAGELDYDLAKSLDPATTEEPREAERTMRDAVKCVTERFVVARKAGGK